MLPLCTRVKEMWQGINYIWPLFPTPHHQVTGYIHTLKDSVSCETSNCIYYWICCKNKCKDYPRCEYTGLISRPIIIRLNKHKQYVRSQLLLKPSGFHFNQPGTSLSLLPGLILEHVKFQIHLSLKQENSTTSKNLILSIMV